nr:hypothetical protein [Candidatus Freyarchaeota archaeon]
MKELSGLGKVIDTDILIVSGGLEALAAISVKEYGAEKVTVSKNVYFRI